MLNVEARISRRHMKRSIFYDGCSSTADSQMHEAFSRIINRRDENMFSFFQPDTQVLIEYQPVHRHHLTQKTRDCTAMHDKSTELLPDQPISERTICPYQHILNYNEKRIPAAISEVECSCEHVKVNGITIHCEPMYYNMRVLLFDDDCQKFVEKVQRVAMACMSVFSNQVTSAKVTHQKAQIPESPV